MFRIMRSQNLLLSDSSSDEEMGFEVNITDADVRAMLRNHVREKKTREVYRSQPEVCGSSIEMAWVTLGTMKMCNYTCTIYTFCW